MGYLREPLKKPYDDQADAAGYQAEYIGDKKQTWGDLKRTWPDVYIDAELEMKPTGKCYDPRCLVCRFFTPIKDEYNWRCDQCGKFIYGAADSEEGLRYLLVRTLQHRFEGRCDPRVRVRREVTR